MAARARVGAGGRKQCAPPRPRPAGGHPQSTPVRPATPVAAQLPTTRPGTTLARGSRARWSSALVRPHRQPQAGLPQHWLAAIHRPAWNVLPGRQLDQRACLRRPEPRGRRASGSNRPEIPRTHCARPGGNRRWLAPVGCWRRHWLRVALPSRRRPRCELGPLQAAGRSKPCLGSSTGSQRFAWKPLDRRRPGRVPCLPGSVPGSAAWQGEARPHNSSGRHTTRPHSHRGDPCSPVDHPLPWCADSGGPARELAPPASRTAATRSAFANRGCRESPAFHQSSGSSKSHAWGTDPTGSFSTTLV